MLGRYVLNAWVLLISSLWKSWEKTRTIIIVYLKCPTSSCRYILEFFSSAKVQRFQNQSTKCLHYAIISWSWLCWNSKILYSNEHSKTSDCKSYNKKVLKMIYAVNVVDIIVYQYWGNRIRVCLALSKTIGKPVTKPKEKRKRTRWEVSSYRHHNWSTVELRRCS